MSVIADVRGSLDRIEGWELGDPGWAEVAALLDRMLGESDLLDEAVLRGYRYELIDLIPPRIVRIGAERAPTKPIPEPVRERVSHLVHVLGGKESREPNRPR